MAKKKIRVLLILVCALVLLGSWRAVSLAVEVKPTQQRQEQTKVEEPAAVKQEKPEEKDIYEQLELFTDVLSTVQTEYVEEKTPKQIIYGALEGMLSSLDPHSQFLEPDIYNEMKVETTGQFGGLGIEITIKDGLLTVISPIDDTPAFKAGLKPGDRIVKIDDAVTRGITILEAVKKLRGKPGTTVELKVLREKEGKFLDFKITRAIIKVQSIKSAKILGDNIGYIRLSEFQERSPQDFEAAMKKLKAEGMDSIIIDLRNNPGGLLGVAVNISEKFIPEGELVVYTKGRIKSQDSEYRSKGNNKEKYLDFPIVVMINEGSASGSEILAGALQDLKRAVILGTKSFGKGSVQTVIPLKDGSAIRLTTSKYFTPSGRTIHEKGIIPDIVVEEQEAGTIGKPKEEEIFEKMEKELEQPADNKEEIKKEKTPPDNQLEAAINAIKAIKAYKTLSKN